MNELYTRELVNQAKQAGVPQEKIAALLQRAEQIASRNVKTAAVKHDIVGSLLAEAGMQKTASSVSYVQGILNEAFTNGANVPQAYAFTKRALDATSKRVVFIEKVSAISNNPRLNQYAEGFLNQAKLAGMGDEEAISLLVDVVDREKAAGHHDDMFKGAPPGGPGGAPGGGVPPMPPGGAPQGGAGDVQGGPGGPGAPGGPDAGLGGGGDAEEAQILQMLQSLPPEEQQQIIQQLLQAISGGQGGPGGPGAGAPPPGAGGPPPGAGGPPPGAGGPPPGAA